MKDPSRDYVGTIRIKPGDDPASNSALRVIAVAGSSPHHVRLTGSDREVAKNGGPWFADEAVNGWPVQSWAEFAGGMGQSRPW